ncbi:MAG: hypothetical protein RID53_08735 [Coleofasciculus sp. B1-GNL1-01]
MARLEAGGAGEKAYPSSIASRLTKCNNVELTPPSLHRPIISSHFPRW